MRKILSSQAILFCCIAFATSDVTVSRLNFLQSSILESDCIVKGNPKILKQVQVEPKLYTDIIWIQPDTIYLRLNKVSPLVGACDFQEETVKLVAFLGGAKFELDNEMVFFLKKDSTNYYVVDFKKATEHLFFLEEEVIDLTKVEHKGMIGIFSINRDWKKNWLEAKSVALPIKELALFSRYLNDSFKLTPYCFYSPIEIGKYFEPNIDADTIYKGELSALNQITSLMVRKSSEKKSWLIQRAVSINLTEEMCQTDRLE